MGCKSPVIIGTEDITVYQGADLDLLDGVIGYDSNRDEIEVTADPSELDMCDVGEHEVVYSASGIDSSQKDISICVEPKLHAPNRCKFKTVYATRMVNIEQAPPPTIDGVDGTVINVGASFDLMSGVSATDVNGNEIEVSYSGIYDLKAEGAIASFVTDLKAPLKLLQVSLSPIQEGTGTPSPSNVRPIKGHESVGVVNVGKNRFDNSLYYIGYSSQLWANGLNTVNVAKTDTGFKVTTEANYGFGAYLGYYKAGVEMTISFAQTGIALTQTISIRRTDTNKLSKSTGISATRVAYKTISNFNTITFTTDEDGHYWIGLYDGTDGIAHEQNISNVQLELGSTATDYVPYKPPVEYTQDFDVTLTEVSKDSTPYLYRAVGDVGGDRLRQMLVGGTVCWNQLIQNVRNGSGGTISVDGDVTTISAFTARYPYLNSNVYHTFVGHKYYACADVKYTGTITENIWMYLNNRTTQWGHRAIVPSDLQNTWIHTSEIYAPNVAETTNSFLKFQYNGTDYANITSISVKGVQFFDLTAMFGSTIADHIYSLEQANAGAGVALFRKLFNKDYYAYNAGELMSVYAVNHKMVGVNQWDEEWEVGGISVNGADTANTDRIRSKNYIPVIPNTIYCIHADAGGGRICYYDGDKTFISVNDGISLTLNPTFTTPSDCQYIRFCTFANYGTTYKNDICINLSDASINGTYYPYEKHEYAFDDITLRGIPKLVNGQIQYDGDTYESDGKVTRKWIDKNLNTLTTSVLSSLNVGTNTVRVYWATSSMAPNNTTEANILCDKLMVYQPDYIVSNDVEGISENKNASSNGLWIRIAKSKLQSNDYAGIVAYLTANEIHVLYSAKTPTTETASTFEEIQICNPHGTEGFTTDNDMPVGHETTYLSRAIYGGTLDLVSGRLVVPVGFGLYDGSEDETWGMETQANDKSFYIARQSDAKPLTDINVSNMLYSTFPFTRNAWEVGSCRLTNGYYNFVVGSVVGATTVDQWRTWLKDNPISYTYELATPQTYQLTPQQIQTLLGTNNVWSEQGEVEVIYSKSIDSDEPTFEVGGLYDITYTATDKCGNKETVTRRIQVGTFRTVLYNDGTLIINEPSDRQAENTAMHGAVRNTYPPLDADHDYVFEPIIDTSGTTAYWDSERGNVTGIIIGSPIRPTDMSYWFMDMTNARFADLTNIDTSNVRFMNNMFNNCSSLTTLDMSNFDTRNVENAFDMLYGCTGLETLNISNWTLNDYLYLAWTNNYSGTVSYIPNVKHFILDNVDTSMMTTMNCMFWGLRYLEELDVSSFDTHNVENMHNMFNGCESLTELDVTNFDTAKVMYMSSMFGSCYGLTELVVDNFITDNVYDMQFMFYGTGVTALNLCNFDTSMVEAMRFMFGYSTDLESIYVDPTKFVTTAVTDDGAQMFEGCTSLMGGNGTEYDSSHTNMEYARVDMRDGLLGYFIECNIGGER